MEFPKFVATLQRAVADNAPAILTGAGIAGTVATAYLTGRASFKAAEVLHNETERRITVALEKNTDGKYDDTPLESITFKDGVRLTWQLYLPAAGAGVGTIACIFFAHRINANRLAAVVAAYAVAEKANSEYKDKVLELFGKKKEEEVRAAVAQSQLDRAEVDGQLLVDDDGLVLCMDAWSGRVFRNTMEGIKAAENWVNHQAVQHGYASLTDFYGRLGLDSISQSDNIGWNGNELMELLFSSAMLSNNKPVLVFTFRDDPSPSFARAYE